MAYGKDPKSQSPEGESSLCKANARRTSTHFVESLNPPKGNPASASSGLIKIPFGDGMSLNPPKGNPASARGSDPAATANPAPSQSPEGESSLCKSRASSSSSTSAVSLNPPKGNPASAS